jgi:hypothetical protein
VKTVTAAEFDRDPRAVYDASQKGPVTVLDSQGRPSMVVCSPTIDDAEDDASQNGSTDLQGPAKDE